MPAFTSAYSPSCTTRAIVNIKSTGSSIKQALRSTPAKIKRALTSTAGQLTIGFGFGLGMHKIYAPLTAKVIRAFGISTIPLDPFRGLGFITKIVFSPFICLIAPIMEESYFRGKFQETCRKKCCSFFKKHGFSPSAANIASRITAIFFASIIFGLSHFSNALVFWCNPILFLPQVIAATFMGIMFGAAKEISKKLHMSNGMHIGNNTLAWAYSIKAS